MPLCTKCWRLKDGTEFYRQWTCKACRNEQQRAWIRARKSKMPPNPPKPQQSKPPKPKPPKKTLGTCSCEPRLEEGHTWMCGDYEAREDGSESTPQPDIGLYAFGFTTPLTSD